MNKKKKVMMQVSEVLANLRSQSSATFLHFVSQSCLSLDSSTNTFQSRSLVLLPSNEISAIFTARMLVDHQDAAAGDKVFERKTEGDEERGRNRNCQR